VEQMKNAEARGAANPGWARTQLADRFGALEERAFGLDRVLGERILLERAKLELAALSGLAPGDAAEVIRRLAKSQGRELPEFCEEIVDCGGRLDGLAPKPPLGLQT
jgi:hypothetical protein